LVSDALSHLIPPQAKMFRRLFTSYKNYLDNCLKISMNFREKIKKLGSPLKITRFIMNTFAVCFDAINSEIAQGFQKSGLKNDWTIIKEVRVSFKATI
jgi:hypothetical protein